MGTLLRLAFDDGALSTAFFLRLGQGQEAVTAGFMLRIAPFDGGLTFGLVAQPGIPPGGP